MTATQSHPIRFDRFKGTRSAWPNSRTERLSRTGRAVPCLFSAVIVGVVESALSTAKEWLTPRKDALKAFEQVEWVSAQREAWLVHQALEGMLRAVESGTTGNDVALGKSTIAELSESVLSRINKVMGGAAYSRHTPYRFWWQAVRALGYLCPPWAMAYEGLFEQSFDDDHH